MNIEHGKNFIGAFAIILLTTCFLCSSAVVVGTWLGVVNYYSAESLKALKKASEK
jgi:hypothetical protein